MQFRIIIAFCAVLAGTIGCQSEKPSAAKWKRILPDGSYVRLAAVYRPLEHKSIFWDPNGAVGDLLPRWYVPEAAAGSQVGIIFERPISSTGERGRFYVSYGFNPVQGQKPEAIFGTGFGQWMQLMKVLPGSRGKDGGIGVEIDSGLEVKSDKYDCVFSAIVTQDQAIRSVRVTAVDMFGRFCGRGEWNQFYGRPQAGAVTMVPVEVYVPKEQVKYFLVHVRPIAWARFEGFAQKPQTQMLEKK